MRRARTTLRTCVALLLIAGVVPFAVARELYRYVNDQGHTVIDYQIPPEYVKNGYEILNSKGVVLRTVPRQLSEAEQKEVDARKAKEEAAQAEEKRMQEWDESLLLRYSTVEDIEAARERALRDLRIRVSILKSNKFALRQQVENYQSQAAELERRGQKVDAERLQVIKDLQGEITSTDRAISDRLREIGAVEAAFAADIDRFKQIQDKVKFRQQHMQEQRQAEQQAGRDDPRR